MDGLKTATKNLSLVCVYFFVDIEEEVGCKKTCFSIFNQLAHISCQSLKSGLKCKRKNCIYILTHKQRNFLILTSGGKTIQKE